MIYEIVPGLYLSNFKSALDDIGILPRNTLVINCTKDLPMVKAGMRFAVDDSPSSENDMTRSLPVIVEHIDKTIRVEHRTVLVHCAAGQQRSAAVVAAYLLYRNRNYTVDDAVRFIRSKKPDAFMYGGVHFENSLKDYYSYLHK